MKLGLLPPVPGAVKLRFATYADYRKLPTPPLEFGHGGLISDWLMLGNDKAGCCAFSGAAHQSMQWCAESGLPALFSDTSVLANYSAVTGYQEVDPDTGQPWPDGQNPTDGGATIGDLARYWRQTGLIDDAGHPHQIVAYADLNPGDLREIWAAAWLFTVGLGYELPESARVQFAMGKPWEVVAGSPIVGGHYVPLIGRHNGMGDGVTWGKPQPITEAFIRAFNNQGVVGFSREMLIKGRSIDGFDDQLLMSDLTDIAYAAR